MPQSYTSAVSALYALGHELSKPRRFDLAQMVKLTAALGHPERRFSSVLVAGTNGKGSTSATLASILQTSGYRTALYTSPHLVHINERIQINGGPISDDAFAALYSRVDEAGAQLVKRGELPQHPSFFEMMTAIAFEHFAANGVDIAVLEVGMGGRLDATNVVEPLLSIITDVALDHQQYLGQTITEIAREKAGIIRERGVLVTLPQHPEANDAIGKAAMERHARAVSAAAYMPNITPGSTDFDRFRPSAGQMAEFARARYFLNFQGEDVLIESPLIGRHQIRNVALAVAAAEELVLLGFSISPQHLAEGVRHTRWPGRFQLVPGDASQNRPDIILDVAHNPAGAWALRAALSEHCEDRPVTIVFGAMRDKAIAEMASILFPIAGHVALTQAAEAARAATPEEIRAATAHCAAESICEPTVSQAVERACKLTPKNGVVVVTGSIYVVGEALGLLGFQK